MECIYNMKQIIRQAFEGLILICFLLFFYNGNSQILMFPSNVYTQNFNSPSPISSWTDNSTITGWYIQGTNTCAFQSHINSTSTATVAAHNNGGFYSYECSTSGDQKIGTRPSNGSGTAAGSTGGVVNGIYMGVRFKNNTPTTCTSIKVTYTGYQLSLAENGNNVNKLAFSYKVSSSAITNLVTTGWTNNTNLDYTAPNNSATGGSNQLQMYVCNLSTVKTDCFFPTVLPGDEIMLRWQDANDANNDPHLAIDNLQVEFFNDNVCIQLLPIELLDFYVTKNTILMKVS